MLTPEADIAVTRIADDRHASGRLAAPAMGLLRRHRDAGPFVHLHPRKELVAAVLRAEDRGLTLFNVEPILAERVDDVRFVRDENGVGAGLWCRAEHLVKCPDAAAVFVC